ncbi:hypothetical protein WG78_10770 [Amantichitinum ursilacus]|uniref:Uncharacterized protein n=1 Tax=Amantichitinum ursilacus TaxID=857265 RepID=A0A0N0XIJ9_9NEIS|nr:hypothetical protein WG78_10770 [Amantichitinum ursilacus]
MTRSKHSKKEIEKVLRYAEALGWTIKARNGCGHAWGTLLCPDNSAECRCGEFCMTSIWSTPKNPDTHAQQLRRVVDHCSVRKMREAAAMLGPAPQDQE